MPSPTSVPEPNRTLADAGRALAAIRARRATHHADLHGYPNHDPADDDDVDIALEWLRTHPAPARGAAAELVDRATLLSYVRQRDRARHERYELALLDEARAHRRGAAVGRELGLSRANVAHRRAALETRHRGVERAPTRREARQAERVRAWCNDHRRELLAVAAEVVDHRDALIALAHDADQAAEAIDAAGQALAEHRPGLPLARAVAYLSALLGGAQPADPVLADILSQAAHLRAALHDLDTNGRDDR